ncbi:MAG: AMP-binding protein [Actinomycetota bacterium]|nr:AMP-binding protein [Actinomycetota bacterium]
MGLHDLLTSAPPRVDLVVADGRRLSSAEIDAAAGSTAAGLRERGVDRGDPVAFQVPNGPDAVVLYRACWRLGAIAAPLHDRIGAAQTSAALAQLGPAACVASPGLPLAGASGAVTPAELVGVDTPAATEPAPDEDALVMFTSGSTGAPKGVVHTHGGLAGKVHQLLEAHGLDGSDVVLMPAPLAHVSGLLHGVLLPGTAGMRTVLMDRWDPAGALDLIEAEGVTYMVGPPTFFLGLMDAPGFTPTRTTSLRLLSCGGTEVTPEFVERAGRELGTVVKRSYGSTEAPTVATSRFDDPPDRMATTDGRALGGTELRIGVDGEVWVRGPEVASGYLDPDQTAASFVDGWFRTGDLGTLDDGWLTVTGRLDDRIIRGGENISAHDVEAHLREHPAVDAAVVVGLADERLGERVAAFVVAPGGFDLDDCRAWFEGRGLTRFLTPEYLEVLDEVPLLPTGKPDRAGLRERAGVRR